MARKKTSAGANRKAMPNERLRRAREQHNLTQKELADKIGVTNITVNRWENGKVIPIPYYRQKLCNFFQMDAEALGLTPPVEKGKMSSRNPLPAVWNVPYRHNPFFTGREVLLKRIHDLRSSGRAIALTQAHAITGLGGIGKTQVAVEYAYRYHKEYRVVLWVRASLPELLVSDFISIAHLLDLRAKDEQDQAIVVAAVKYWLKEHKNWLLILDDADDVQIASDLIGSLGAGHVLLTTRTQHSGTFAQRIEVKKMEPEEGVRFLLRRAEILALDMPFDNAPKIERHRARELAQLLDGLPLALDQAGAYIQATACGLHGYLELYHKRSIDLLSTRDLRKTSDHPASVVVTLSLAFAGLQEANPAAADLLRLCAFLHPDAIPEEIITAGAAHLGPLLEPVATNRMKLDFTIADLRRFSLLERDPDSRTLTVHRLVQEVFKHSMDEQTRRQWAERAVRAVSQAFPDVEFTHWQQCQRLLAHAQACAAHIVQYNMVSPEAARLLDLTGRYLYQRGRYSEADPFLHTALAIQEQVQGPEHADTAACLNNLAELYQAQGKYEQAEPLYRRALAVREKVLGPDHPATATSLNNLAELYQTQGKYEEAEPLYQRALAMRESVLGPEHPDAALSLNNLAVLYADQGKYEQAEALSQRDLAIKEKVLGPEHPDVATSLHNLAGFYHTEGKYTQAEPLYQRALAIFEKMLGPQHATTAFCLDSLAGLYADQGEYKRAEALSRRALAIKEQVLGVEHPDVSQSLITLALLYQAQGKYEQAESLYRRALAIYEKALGPEHAYTAGSLTYLAALYLDQGKYQQAEPLSLRALVIKEKVLGPEHPSTATSLNTLARCYQLQGNYEQAESFYQRALAVREKVLGAQHPDTAATLRGLASLYQAQDRYEQAEQLYQRALTIYEKALGPQHPDTAQALKSYSGLLRETHREGETATLRMALPPPAHRSP
jgi:tetratricopeptide (TPR) repeat protein/transcriptional regulator with XRE-family HTH domain